MGETYAEAGVSSLPTMKTYLIKFVIIFLTVASLFLSLSVSPVLITFVMICIMAMVFIFPGVSYDYEYIYCDGQIDFDR
ncbi:hypothetical protein, partial [Anaerosporobacter sp.]|uniref:hypothetical protein n=1 Tax=Anaerosporobacter sp. TaxID=1872529 RepID=UPI00286F2D48